MTYILENNGVYGLTKGQFSATADKGSKAKKGATNKDEAIDTVSLALLMGATFVARSFSGDKKQLTPLIKAAIAHQGAAFIDVVSPCVAFNNHAGSTKSYDYVREHNEAVNRLDFWPNREAITVDYSEGGVIEVPQHDGSIIKLRKLAADYDPSDKVNAITHLARAAEKGEVLTGLLYLSADAEDLHAHLNTYEAPFNKLAEKDLCPGSVMLDKINAALR
jgi:2-oxoglutarate ferredoxin oxidoreductase subunit beta